LPLPLRPALVVLLILPLVACACGGGSDDEKRLTADELVAEANQVCIASDRRIFRLGQLTTNPADWRRTARAAARGIADMARLRPPQDKQERFDAMLDSARQLQKIVTEIAGHLEKKNYAKAQTTQARATRLDTRIKLQARALGLTFCEQFLTNWPA
jgi:prophage DNA circulation protein